MRRISCVGFFSNAHLDNSSRSCRLQNGQGQAGILSVARCYGERDMARGSDQYYVVCVQH
jgi:hypothetical protein